MDFKDYDRDLHDPFFWGALIVLMVVVWAISRKLPRPKLAVLQLQDELSVQASTASLTLARNLLLGSAAASLACLLGILQIGATDQALQHAVNGAAIGMPCWLCAASCYEAVLALSPSSHAWLLTGLGRNVAVIPGLPAAVGLIVAIGGIIYHLLAGAICFFIAATVAAIVYYTTVHWMFARWWMKNQGPTKRP